MGIPVTPPIVPDPVGAGSLCNTCWGTGRTFGDGPTPDSIFINVSGINKGPSWTPFVGEPPNGRFQIPQLIGLPCFYVLPAPPIRWAIIFGNIFTLASGDFQPGARFFFGETEDLCGVTMLNQTLDPFVGGSMVVEIPEVA